MFNAILNVCAVPLNPGEARHRSCQWCPTCHRWQVTTSNMVFPLPLPHAAAAAAAAGDGADMTLPDVITSNTPPPTPTHNTHFFLADEPWSAHNVASAYLPVSAATANPTEPVTPRWHLDLPQVCRDALFAQKVQDGASCKAEDTCLTLTQVGRELRRLADTFYIRPRENLQESHHYQDVDAAVEAFSTAFVEGLCISLLCLVSWKILTRLKEVIEK